MIKTKQADVTIPGNYLQKVLHDRDFIKALAREIVGSMVEARLDMAADCGDVAIETFKQAQEYVGHARQDADYYLQDILVEFRDALHEAVAATTVEVTSVKFGKDGLEDADVVVQ